VAELNAYDVVVIGNSGFSNGDGFEQFAGALRSWVEAGGGVVMTGWGVFGAGTGSGTPVPDINVVIPVNTAGSYGYFSGGSQIVPNGTPHPVTDGVAAFTLSGNDYAEYPATNPQVDPGATVLATTGSQPTVVVGDVSLGRGVYLGPIYAGYSGYNNTELRTGTADRLFEQAAAWAGAIDRLDGFAFQATEGDNLLLTTTTPGGGPGEPVNALDPQIELYNPLGFLVASDDNSATDGRNVRLRYLVPTGGTGRYAVQVTAPNSGADPAEPQLCF
jgi:hypothetical protein